MGAISTSSLETELDAAETTEQHLSFRCMEGRYALPIDLVREIIEYGQVTAVPMMPPFIRGVINLRGHVVPVVDLASRFGLGETRLSRRTCIIILELNESELQQQMGLVVDAVDSVFDLDEAEIEAAPRFGTGIRADFIAGMARSEDGFTVLLDIGRVLSLNDMRQIAAAAVAGDKQLSEEPPAQQSGD